MNILHLIFLFMYFLLFFTSVPVGTTMKKFLQQKLPTSKTTHLVLEVFLFQQFPSCTHFFSLSHQIDLKHKLQSKNSA